MRLIPHDGSQMSILSAIRGDIDWVQYPFSTLKNSIVDTKDLIPLMVYDSKRLSLLPDVPTVAELGYSDLVDVVKQFRPVMRKSSSSTESSTCGHLQANR